MRAGRKERKITANGSAFANCKGEQFIFESYRGVSGGGLWAIELVRRKRNHPGTEELDGLVLVGVAFYQLTHCRRTQGFDVMGQNRSTKLRFKEFGIGGLEQKNTVNLSPALDPLRYIFRIYDFPRHVLGSH